MGISHHGIPAVASPRQPYARQVTVAMPKDLALSRLLLGSGGKFERLVNTLAIAASPDHAQRTVSLPAAVAGHVASHLATLLAGARAEDHPATTALAAVAAQLGVTEDPGPAAAAPGKPAAPTLSGGSAK